MSDTWEEHFIASLEGLRKRKDRAALADLRRPSTGDIPFAVYRYLPRGLKPWQEEPALLVANLFATHPEEGGRGDLGASLADIPDPSGNMEKRFAALLNCHGDDLPYHLRQVVSLLRSKEVAVNWLQLLRDLQGWSHEDHFVQERWAKSYWGNKKPEDTSAAANGDSVPE